MEKRVLLRGYFAAACRLLRSRRGAGCVILCNGARGAQNYRSNGERDGTLHGCHQALLRVDNSFPVESTRYQRLGDETRHYVPPIPQGNVLRNRIASGVFRTISCIHVKAASIRSYSFTHVFCYKLWQGCVMSLMWRKTGTLIHASTMDRQTSRVTIFLQVHRRCK